jgi:hypothetical protein
VRNILHVKDGGSRVDLDLENQPDELQRINSQVVANRHLTFDLVRAEILSTEIHQYLPGG